MDLELLKQSFKEQFNEAMNKGKVVPNRQYKLNKDRVCIDLAYNPKYCPEWISENNMVVWIEEIGDYLLVGYPDIKIYHSWIVL